MTDAMARIGQDHAHQVPAILSWDAGAVPSHAALGAI